MVKVGFICEGETEKIILESERFQRLLSACGLQYVSTIDVGGNKELLHPGKLAPRRNLLLSEGAERIFVLTDLDEHACLVELRNDIEPHPAQQVVVVVRDVESWFLADHRALKKMTGRDIEEVEYPEKEIDPFGKIVALRGKGFGRSKPLCARKMNANGFSLENAAGHPNCPSARYFLNKLKSLNLPDT